MCGLAVTTIQWSLFSRHALLHVSHVTCYTSCSRAFNVTINACLIDAGLNDCSPETCSCNSCILYNVIHNSIALILTVDIIPGGYDICSVFVCRDVIVFHPTALLNDRSLNTSGSILLCICTIGYILIIQCPPLLNTPINKP